uniref:Sec-independent protein translocase component TatC n=1 Tax=Laurenciella marilzae TaxID=1413812 RepID=A0A1Z1M205_9FLOR|nr:Sec-independent protein translocase component TatC [Laurenciella marilzae]ARW59804.1 Sec-independent protein translocase component TatC [Laurenciella marilzae]
MKKLYYNKKSNNNMPIIEHFIELRQRILISLLVFTITLLGCIAYSKQITFILQEPALGIKFLQLAPGEYLFVSIKIAIYTAILISSPFSLYQILLFVLPGLTKKESKYIIPLLTGSILLFLVGIIFSYNILIPITLQFLIKYGSDIVEPIWSLEEYFNFIILILFSVGISFQIPILQIILGVNNIINKEKMLKSWKYVAFIATIIGAVITPSTDPITQSFMTITIIALYFSGILTLTIIQK